jgi:hypothetical protein
VPDRKVAHKEPLAILHASFADYLRDPSRSGEFYIGADKDVDEGVGLRILAIWKECSGDDIGAGMYGVLVFISDTDVVSTSASVEATWQRYCLKLDDKPSRAITKFHGNLFRDLISSFSWITIFLFEPVADSPIYAELCKLHMTKLSYYFDANTLWLFVANLMVKYSSVLTRM